MSIVELLQTAQKQVRNAEDIPEHTQTHTKQEWFSIGRHSAVCCLRVCFWQLYRAGLYRKNVIKKELNYGEVVQTSSVAMVRTTTVN